MPAQPTEPLSPLPHRAMLTDFVRPSGQMCLGELTTNSPAPIPTPWLEVVHGNPRETCTGEPEHDAPVATVGGYEVVRANPCETCTGDLVVVGGVGAAEEKAQCACACACPPTFRPAYELQDGSLERAGRGAGQGGGTPVGIASRA